MAEKFRSERAEALRSAADAHENYEVAQKWLDDADLDAVSERVSVGWSASKGPAGGSVMMVAVQQVIRRDFDRIVIDALGLLREEAEAAEARIVPGGSGAA